MTTSDFTSEAKELDARTGDGFDVRLFWHPATDTVTVSVFDATHEQSFELVVEPGKALDAFRHPSPTPHSRASPSLLPSARTTRSRSRPEAPSTT